MDGVDPAGRPDPASAGFPTLEADLGDGRREGAGAMKRVCIATPDIADPEGNTGIGAACRHLARFLAEQGHTVVVAYVNDRAADARLMEEVRTRYAGFGVAFESVLPRRAGDYVLGRDWAPTWALLDWLRVRERLFDLVHVPDRSGLGYASLLAKSLGLAFGGTHFVVHGSSPTLWEAEGDRRLLATEREIGWVFTERRCVELADTFVCDSVHLLEWIRDAGCVLPGRSFVWPGVFPAPEATPAALSERAARDGARLEEVVFFGRLEHRKGLALFIEAIDRLVRRGRPPAARLTFLGGVSASVDGPELVRSRSRSWPMEVRTLTGFGMDEAVAYLRRPGRLAVIPSLRESASMAVMECLQAGIPFIAAATGGTPELVAPEDHARALVASDHVALGERIAELADVPLSASRPRRDFERSLEVWSRWHMRTEPFAATAARFGERARTADAQTPLVTVCIVHHERPELVRMAVDSVFAQDYPALEAVLVDDGSESAGALAALDALEAEFAERGWRVIRRENRYPGASRNAAVAAARGDWVLFLDDDNVLFPDAVARLVRAARFSGADCVPAASVPFFGDGDPRTDTRSHGAPIRFLGAARTLNLIENVCGDTFMLVRRGVFEAVGGFDEEYGLSLGDMEFCNHLMRSGRRVEPLPDPAYYYRIQPKSMISRMKDRRVAEASRARVLTPHIEGLPAEERAFAAFATACVSHKLEALRQTLIEREGQVATLNGAVAERDGQIAALNGTVVERDGRIVALNGVVAGRDGRIAALNGTVAERDGQIAALNEKLDEVFSSTSWRLSRPLRGIKLALRSILGRIGAGATGGASRGRWSEEDGGDGGSPRLAAGAAGASGAAVPASSVPWARSSGKGGETEDSPSPVPKAPWDRQPGKGGPCPPVAMLVRDFYDGGLEKVVSDVASQLMKQGVACSILVMGSGGRAARLAEENDCRVREFGGDVAELVSTVRREGIGVVVIHHCHEPLEPLSKAGVKLVEVIHNLYSWQRGDSHLSALRARCIDRFIAVSDAVRDYALAHLSIPADRIDTIENGLSRHGLIRPRLRVLSRRRGATADRPLMVHVANAFPPKNHVAIVRAFESILPDHPGARLVLAGVIDHTTDVGRRVRSEIESRGLHDSVRCSGPLGRRELSRLLSDAHVGLLPSVFEGFSIGTLEYTYFGLPVVLSDTGAARRLSDRYGHVVIADAAAFEPEMLESARIHAQALEPEPHTVAGIAAGMRAMLADYAGFADAAQRAGMDWQSYSIEATAGRYRSLLAETSA